METSKCRYRWLPMVAAMKLFPVWTLVFANFSFLKPIVSKSILSGW